jgi:hypothetical protein
VVARGVGLAEKNTARSIQILKQVRNYLRPKITMMQTVVGKRKDSNKRTTVLEVIQVTVENGGKVLNLVYTLT